MARHHAADRRQQGMTTLEIALMLPILFIILCGIIEASNMLRIQVTLSSAATALAREVAIDPTVRTEAAAVTYMAEHNLITGVQQNTANNVPTDAPVLTLSPENPTCTSASCDPFTVGLNYTYLAVTPVMRQLFDGVVLSTSVTKTTEPSTASTTTTQ